METIRQDVKFAVRALLKRPAMSLMVVVTLALGIGATTAIFSVVEGVLLRPLPFPEPERLIQIWGTVPARGLTQTSLTEANFWDVRDMNRSLSDVGAWHSASFTLSIGGGGSHVILPYRRGA